MGVAAAGWISRQLPHSTSCITLITGSCGWIFSFTSLQCFARSVTADIATNRDNQSPPDHVSALALSGKASSASSSRRAQIYCDTMALYWQSSEQIFQAYLNLLLTATDALICTTLLELSSQVDLLANIVGTLAKHAAETAQHHVAFCHQLTFIYDFELEC